MNVNCLMQFPVMHALHGNREKKKNLAISVIESESQALAISAISAIYMALGVKAITLHVK